MKTALEIATRTIQLFEQLRLQAYDDATGRPLRVGDVPRGRVTIGYGRIRRVKPGDTCTEAQALAWLQEEMKNISDALDWAYSPWSDGAPWQTAALWSFGYNEGSGPFPGNNRLGMALRGRGSRTVPEAMLTYTHASGDPKRLLKRRQVEIVLYELPAVLERLLRIREELSDLQALLFLAGHDPGPIDGIFGRRTQAAIHAFQRRTGQEPDVWDSDTVRALGLDIAGLDIDEALAAAVEGGDRG